MSLDLSRHIDLYTPKDAPVPHVIGVGAVGSHIAYMLSKLGCPEIHLYDFDVVEGHNIANQFFTYRDVGSTKVDAMLHNIEYFVGEGVAHGHHGAVRGPKDMALTGDDVVFLIVDSLDARREIIDNFQKAGIVCHVLETRMGAFNAEVYSFPSNSPKTVKRWLESLPDDDTPLEVSACGSAITVGMTATGLASMCVWSFVNYLKFDETEFCKKYDFRNAVSHLIT